MLFYNVLFKYVVTLLFHSKQDCIYFFVTKDTNTDNTCYCKILKLFKRGSLWGFPVTRYLLC